MYRTRAIITTILGALAGLLAGFGITTLYGNDAYARLATEAPAVTDTNLNLQTGTSNTSTSDSVAANVGVGGSFVTDVYNSVSPAVVHITNRSVAFNPFIGSYPSEATGSGVIVDRRGYILTNHHVIAGAKDLIVVLNDGTELAAETVGSDPGTDLALIKVDAETNLPAAKLGSSTDVQVGEWVVAIGNPRGLDWTVTVGVVSALNRETISQAGQTIRGLIQTDASINPGNSGGPLLNARGEVIGINEQIISTSGGSQGIGLAVPINTAKEVLDDLVQHGRVIRPWLGFKVLEEVTPKVARLYNLPSDYGVIVGTVYQDSPAIVGGLMAPYSNRRGDFRYDILSAVGNERVENYQQLLDLIRNMETGDSVTLGFYRIENGEYQFMEQIVTLEELPNTGGPLMGII